MTSRALGKNFSSTYATSGSPRNNLRLDGRYSIPGDMLVLTGLATILPIPLAAAIATRAPIGISARIAAVQIRDRSSAQWSTQKIVPVCCWWKRPRDLVKRGLVTCRQVSYIRTARQKIFRVLNMQVKTRGKVARQCLLGADAAIQDARESLLSG